jgi:hypothetical protein
MGSVSLWPPIVEQVAEASFAAITSAHQLVSEITDIRQRWNTVINARPQATAWRIADLALRLPVFDAETVTRELGTSSANAVRALGPLIEAGVLTEFTGMRRNQMWQAREILPSMLSWPAQAAQFGVMAPQLAHPGPGRRRAEDASTPAAPAAGRRAGTAARDRGRSSAR